MNIILVSLSLCFYMTSLLAHCTGDSKLRESLIAGEEAPLFWKGEPWF